MEGNDFYSDIKWFYANYKSLSKKFENIELKEKAKEQKIDLRKKVVKFIKRDRRRRIRC